ncbi:hypothetical protein PV325_003635 [Microctonus aethiopoides]|nr:hypothetical protein PV325_003635 [Microctonus aethiopoides]KAK0098392.1 hypothetical protein PV326_008824 [Microctonus aethiopoides]
MPGPDLPEVPASMKSIQHYLKIATEHDARDPVVAYWARLYAAQTALGISKKKSQEENIFLVKLMNWLEETKKELHDNEAISNDVAAQAHLENWALKLFLYADKNDRASNFSKNVVQSFYTAGLLYDVLTIFGELSEEASQNRKYAKWKAAYIHNCLKNGDSPIPGPINQDNDISQSKPETNDAGDETNADLELNPGPENIDSGSENNEDQPDVEPENLLEDNSSSEPANEDVTSESQDNIEPTPPPNTNSFGFPSVPNNSSDSNINPASSVIPSYPNLPSTPPTPQIPSNIPTPQSGSVSLNPDQMQKAQKYIKWAGSAINYDDIPTAVNNLQKALHLLTTGED